MVFSLSLHVTNLTTLFLAGALIDTQMRGKIKKRAEKITLQAASPWTSCSGGRTAEIERPTSGLESEDVMLPQRRNPREGREGGRQQSPVPTQLNRIRFQVSWLISDTTSWRWCPEVNITYKTSRCTDPVSVSPLIPDRNVKLVPEKRNESESRSHFLFNNRASESRVVFLPTSWASLVGEVAGRSPEWTEKWHTDCTFMMQLHNFCGCRLHCGYLRLSSLWH